MNPTMGCCNTGCGTNACGTSNNFFAYILILFILIAIIGCYCQG